MRTAYDVVVVGAGPAGSAAALVAARAGRRVLLIERGEYPGSKNVSGAAFYGTPILRDLLGDFWETAPLERRVRRRVLHLTAPGSDFALDYSSEAFTADPPNAFTLLRPRFDRWLAGQAVEAGARLLVETVVDDLLTDGRGRVAGVRTRNPGGEIDAGVVIAADGVNSFLARRAGLQRELKAADVSLGVKEILGLERERLEERFNLNGTDGVVHEYLGSVTGGVRGGAFLYTNLDSLSVGVIVQLSSLAASGRRPYEILQEFKRHPSVQPLVRGARLREYSAHLVPEAGWKMLSRLHGHGILVAGDAAGLCFATGLWLEGINYAIVSGMAAGETAAEAVAAGDTSERRLAAYGRRLLDHHVVSDFERFRTAPGLIHSRRMQEVYPELVNQIASDIFHSRGTAKPKLLPLLRARTRAAGLSPLTLLRDLVAVGRGFGW